MILSFYRKLYLETMKTTTKIFSICITAIIISLGSFSCDGDGSEAIEPDPSEPDGENNVEVLLTDNLIKQWRLVDIYDFDNASIPGHKWSECEKSEILTFNTDKSFSISCSGNGISLFKWNISETEGKTLLNLESVAASKAPLGWMSQKIVIRLLTENALVIEINGIKYEYASFYLENIDPRD
jgi:hypothetical protein